MVEVEGIFAKMECTNPMGSIKDRIASYIIEESERRGLLRFGMEIVEASSGNTGIAFAYFARERGYPISNVMPENMSRERRQILRVLGARVVLCPPGDFIGATRIRDEMVAEDPQRFTPDQFSNPFNVQCHYETTGVEILDQMRKRDVRIDAVVAGLGTGGTIIGIGKRLREDFPDVKVIAIEPAESAVINGGSPGIHGIQGIGGGFIPAIASDGAGGLHPLIDGVEICSTEEAIAAAQYLADEAGLCVASPPVPISSSPSGSPSGTAPPSPSSLTGLPSTGPRAFGRGPRGNTCSTGTAVAPSRRSATPGTARTPASARGRNARSCSTARPGPGHVPISESVPDNQLWRVRAAQVLTTQYRQYFPLSS
jgi:cysteine synthase A